MTEISDSLHIFSYRTSKNREKRLRDCMLSSLNTIFLLIRSKVSEPNKAVVSPFKFYTVCNLLVQHLCYMSQMKQKPQRVWQLRTDAWGETTALLICSEKSRVTFSIQKHPTGLDDAVGQCERHRHWTVLLALKVNLNKWHWEKLNLFVDYKLVKTLATFFFFF